MNSIQKNGINIDYGSIDYSMFSTHQNLIDWDFNAVYDPRNVRDEFKYLDRESIKSKLKETMIPLWVGCVNWSHDINFASMVRSSNAFGIPAVIQLSNNKKWDRRGSVGTHHYTDVYHCQEISTLIEFVKQNNMSVICFDTNIDREVSSLANHLWNFNKPTLALLGSEHDGIPNELLDLADHVISIEQFGSTRSLNVAAATSIIEYDYRLKRKLFHNVRSTKD